jgi:hypothetical protein
MSLLQQQILLGRCLLATDVEAAICQTATDTSTDADGGASLRNLIRGTGFCFTRHVRRSWSIARTAGAVQLTLSALAREQRRRFVEDWVDAGGGNALDVTTEAAGFLEYLSQRLPDPSHALSVCEMERAAYRASAAAANFTVPDSAVLDDPDTVLHAGRDAALVRFFAEPRRLFEALSAGAPLPTLDGTFAYLFAPGLPTLRRSAREDEAALWDRLSAPTAGHALRDEGISKKLMLELLAIGAIEPGE